MMRTLFIRIAVSLSCILSFANGLQAVEIIRNGSFENGMDGWKVSRDLGTWNPYWDDNYESNNYLMLCNMDHPYQGTIVYQPLNVSNVAGKRATISLRQQYHEPYDPGVWLILDYIDNNNIRHSERVQTIKHESGSWDWETVTSTYVIPPTAKKLIRLSINNATRTDMHNGVGIDDISITADDVQVSAVPTIEGVSLKRAKSGDVITVTGHDFGPASDGNLGIVSKNSTANMQIERWSNTEIVAKLDSAVRSGWVTATSGQTESLGDFFVFSDSPSYTVTALQPDQRVLRGQKAEFVFDVQHYNGFKTARGITFTLPESLQAIAQMLPQTTMTNPGGMVLHINTSGLLPGMYCWDVRAGEAGCTPNVIPIRLVVTSTASVKFTDRYSNQIVTSADITDNNPLNYSVDIIGDDGLLVTGDAFAARIEDPTIAKLRDGYYVCAVANGSTNLVIGCKDGTEARLPINCTITNDATLITGLTMEPRVFSNLQPDIVLTVTTTGVDYLGDLPYEYFSWSWTEWSADHKTATIRAKVRNDLLPGQYHFAVYCRKANEDGSNIYDAKFLDFEVVNDPSKGRIDCTVYNLSPNNPGYQYGAWLSAISIDGRPSREVDASCTSTMQATFANLDPGDYFVRIGYENSLWYANTNVKDEASRITLAAGQTITDIAMFLPPTQPSASIGFEEFGPSGALLENPIRFGMDSGIDMRALCPDMVMVTDDNHYPVEGEVTLGTNYIEFKPYSHYKPSTTYTATLNHALGCDGRLLPSPQSAEITTESNLIADYRRLPEGYTLALYDKPVYFDSRGIIYVEDFSRTAGIMLKCDNWWTLPFLKGKTISFYGTFSRTSGEEPYIEVRAEDIFEISDAPCAIRPFAVNNRSATDQLLTGLRTTCWGKVLSKAPNNAYMVISDGSDTTGVRVVSLSCALSDVKPGDFVMVTGAAGYDNGRVIYKE